MAVKVCGVAQKGNFAPKAQNQHAFCKWFCNRRKISTPYASDNPCCALLCFSQGSFKSIICAHIHIHTRTHGLIYTRIINPQSINVNSKFKISLIIPHFSLQKVSFYACRMPVVCTEVNICRFSYILQICIFMQLYAIFMHLKHVLCAF